MVRFSGVHISDHTIILSGVRDPIAKKGIVVTIDLLGVKRVNLIRGGRLQFIHMQGRSIPLRRRPSSDWKMFAVSRRGWMP